MGMSVWLGFCVYMFVCVCVRGGVYTCVASYLLRTDTQDLG